MIEIKSPGEIENMREGGVVLASLMLSLSGKIEPGVRADDLDQWAEDFILSRGGTPAFKGYRGYPASLCVSINEVIVHGIPIREMVFQEGDIVGIDVGMKLKNFFTDMSMTFPVGRIDDEAGRLISATRDSLYQGIDACREDNRVSDISHAIQNRVLEDKFSVVEIFVGHGIGRQLHEDPQIPNFGEPHRGPRLKPGMVLALEPMVNQGTAEVVIDQDGWTARTADGRLSAHFEHTVAVGENGPEILTLTDDGTDPIWALR